MKFPAFISVLGVWCIGSTCLAGSGSPAPDPFFFSPEYGVLRAQDPVEEKSHDYEYKPISVDDDSDKEDISLVGNRPDWFSFASQNMKDKTGFSYPAIADFVFKSGNDRTIGSIQYMTPLLQQRGKMIFADLRTVIDNQDSFEGNAGLVVISHNIVQLSWFIF